MTAPVHPTRFGHDNPELRRPIHPADAGEPFITLPPLVGFAPFPRETAGDGGPAAGSISPPMLSAADKAPLPGLGPDGSVAQLLRRRIDQIGRGYTPESDLNLPIGWLLREALRYGQDAGDWLQRPNQDRGRTHYENKLIAMGALVLAELDRLHATRTGAPS